MHFMLAHDAHTFRLDVSSFHGSWSLRTTGFKEVDSFTIDCERLGLLVSTDRLHAREPPGGPRVMQDRLIGAGNKVLTHVPVVWLNLQNTDGA